MEKKEEVEKGGEGRKWLGAREGVTGEEKRDGKRGERKRKSGGGMCVCGISG